MAFKKGNPKPPNSGRKKGVQNRVTREVRDLAQELVGDPVYLKFLADRLRNGKCAPQVETMLWHYGFGKPAERVRFENDGKLDIAVARQIAAEVDEERRAKSRRKVRKKARSRTATAESKSTSGTCRNTP